MEIRGSESVYQILGWRDLQWFHSTVARRSLIVSSKSLNMFLFQERSRSGIPQRSPSAEPFQRGVPERSTAPVRSAPPGPYQRGSPQRMSSKTLPRSQDGRTTPTNTPRSMTMPRQGEKGQVYRPHPENGGRPMEQRLSGEQRIQNTVQTTTMGKQTCMLCFWKGKGTKAFSHW